MAQDLLNRDLMSPHDRKFQHTKIVATLGPSTDSPEFLEKMILAGVDLLRLNMAHATRFRISPLCCNDSWVIRTNSPGSYFDNRW